MTHIAGEVLQVAEARSEGFCILTKSGRVVVGSEDEFGHFGQIKNHDDTHRIVACVNACEGIGTECLESMPINKSYLDAVCAREEWEARAIKEASRAADLQEQIDELLAVVELAQVALFHCRGGGALQAQAHEAAIKVINKITGETK